MGGWEWGNEECGSEGDRNELSRVSGRVRLWDYGEESRRPSIRSRASD